jgi:hypothetical protein
MTDIAEELKAIRHELDRLKSREAIRQQLARYGRGQEWLDVTLMNDVFFEDADINFGFFKGVWRDYRPVLMEIEAASESTFHMCACEQIEFEGDDTAHVEVYGLAGGGGGSGFTQIYGGRYMHRFERRDGVWKSARCHYVLDWTLRQPEDKAVSESLTGINRITHRSPENPLFRRMGMDVTG